MRRQRRKWRDCAGFEDGPFVAARWQTAGRKRRQPSKRRAGKEGEEGRMLDEGRRREERVERERGGGGG